MGILSSIGYAGGSQGGSGIHDLIALSQLDMMEEAKRQQIEARKLQTQALIQKATDTEQARGILSSLPRNQVVEAPVAPPSDIEMFDYVPNGYTEKRTAAVPSHEWYRQAADKLMGVNPELGVKFQALADAERKAVIDKKVEVGKLLLDKMISSGVPEPKIQALYDKLSADADVGTYFPAGMGMGTKDAKEFNIPADLDTFLAGKASDLGIDYFTPQGRQTALTWYGTPAGRGEFNAWWDKRKLTAPAANVFIGTTPQGGIVTMPSRGNPTPTVTAGPEGGIGPKIISEDYKKDVTALGQAEDLVNRLKANWDTLPTSGRMQSVQLYSEGKIGSNPKAKLYADSSGSFSGNLARSIAAERGVLTDQDIQRINKAIPQLGINPLSVDSKAEAQAKWEQIQGIIADAKKRMLQRHNITSANPTGMSQRVVLDTPTTAADMQRAGIPIPPGATVRKTITLKSGKVIEVE